MLAAYYTRIGPAHEVLQLGEMPTPNPAAGEVRVKVRWSGVNPSDVKMRLGSRGPVPSQTSIIPHSDGMGEIDAVGAGVDPSRRGERVWIWNAAWGRPHGTAHDRSDDRSDDPATSPHLPSSSRRGGTYTSNRRRYP